MRLTLIEKIGHFLADAEDVSPPSLSPHNVKTYSLGSSQRPQRSLAAITIASWLLSPLQNLIFFRRKTDITKSAWINPWIDVSTAKSLGLDINLLGKSFMYAKKKNGPKLDSWGTPALMGDYLDDLPFRTSLCCLFLRNEFIIP